MNYELHTITTADGQVYTLQQGNRFLLTPSPNGWGLPPIDYATIRYYQADEDVETTFTLGARRFSVGVRAQGCSRQQLFELRQDILNMVRPNRNGLLTYTFIDEVGNKRAVTARVVGLPFGGYSPDKWDEWNYQDSIDFLCHNPVWFNPASTTQTGTAISINELVFPITFPIFFGQADLFAGITVNYVGSWYSYPVIHATGAFTNLRISNLSTGQDFVLTGTVNSGQSITIDLQAGYDSQGNPVGIQITDDTTGDSLFGFLSPTTNIVKFRIEPDPIAAGGVNEFEFSATGTDGNTAVSMTYNERYIGI